MPKMPTLFISHGAPNVLLADVPARDFLIDLASQLPTIPSAIVMVSAHWETDVPTVNVPKVHETIYDFGGFERELYQQKYPAPSAPDTATRIIELAKQAGVTVRIDAHRGLDHGAWVPLLLAWPQADIPVLQLSIQTHLGVQAHLDLGAILEPLRAENVLIIGSGSFTHDLASFGPHRHDVNAPEPDWVTVFADWMHTAILDSDKSALIDYRQLAPQAARNHPTEEHLLPLYVAMAAAGGNSEARLLHSSTTHGVLRMDAYAFGDRS